MALLTVIGRGVRIRGRVTGDADLTIEGHVEGEVAVTGDVTIDAGGLVGANVNARVIIVRGAVRGDLTGEELVRLEEGARVVGDLRAPRIAIAKGALVRGLVQTGGSSGRGTHASSRAKAEAPAARRAPVAAPQKAVAQVAPPAPRAAPAAVTKTAAATVPRHVAGAATPVRHVAKGPPPPVVPSLKKGAKAALKKKAH
jgi:cytoskeletal protein CcmA (bactofilin family)